MADILSYPGLVLIEPPLIYFWRFAVLIYFDFISAAALVAVISTPLVFVTDVYATPGKISSASFVLLHGSLEILSRVP